MYKFIQIVFVCIAAVWATEQRYDGTTVVRLSVQKSQITTIDEFVRKHPKLDEWGRHLPTRQPGSRNITIDVMVQPEAGEEFWNLVTEQRIKYDIIIPDVQSLVDSQRTSSQVSAFSTLRKVLTVDRFHETLVGRYPRYQEVMDWVYRLSGEKPDLVSLIDIGASSENRLLRVVKISSAPRGVHRKSIWIDAAVHAREWIGPATAIYIIDKLVHNYGSSPNITRLVDNYDWYILPIANPDGYEFSHTHNRLWRKTRSRHGLFAGVDLNRNFDYHWKNCSLLGDTPPGDCFDNHPAYDVYAGPKPLSEPESAAMARFLLDHKGQFLFYFSLHAYAQFWLVPWAHSHVLADDFVEMMLLAEIGTTALARQFGTNYVRGPPAIILYQAGGTTMDWAKGVAGIKYSFILELRDTGRYGFLLPEREILPTATETFHGIASVLEALANPTKRAQVFAHGRGKRRVQTMQRYRRYLERHVSFWGGVNRSYTISDDDDASDDYGEENDENVLSWPSLLTPT